MSSKSLGSNRVGWIIVALSGSSQTVVQSGWRHGRFSNVLCGYASDPLDSERSGGSGRRLGINGVEGEFIACGKNGMVDRNRTGMNQSANVLHN